MLREVTHNIISRIRENESNLFTTDIINLSKKESELVSL